MIVAGDERWLIEGGRAGYVKYAEGDVRAEMAFEILVGDSVMVIYGEQCGWTAPEARKMNRDEVRRLGP
jgi:hypothetical protein